MKRVLFIINRMNCRISSGHAIFMKGVIDSLTVNGHYIDIVVDGEPEDTFLSDYGLNVYYPDKQDRLTYGKHSNLFQFSDSFNFEKAVNFQLAITKALSNHIYDLIICNDTESAFVCYQMELYKYIKVTTYAHECQTVNPELQEGVFKDCYYDLIEKMMSWKELTTLIQTDLNKEKLESKIGTENSLYVQPYALTDSNPISSLNQDGLLFIGRYEDRKNPGVFIKALADIKAKYGVEIKANVLTRSAHVKKFEEDFKSIGHTNYEIKADVVGEEKAKIIQSSKVALMPYKNESFGIAVLESLRYMPTIVLSKYDWHYNFKGMSNLIVAAQSNIADVIWEAYNEFTVNETQVMKEFNVYNERFENSLLTLINSDCPNAKSKQEPRNRLYKYLQENKGQWKSLVSYFQSENTKGTIYLTSDIETLYTGLGWFNVQQYTNYTFVGLPNDKGEINMPIVTKIIETEGNNTLSSFFG